MTSIPLPFRPPTPPTGAKPPVVVGLDGSPAGFTALDWAARDASSRGVGLRLVHVHPRGGHALSALDMAPRDVASDIFAEAIVRLDERRLADLRVSTVFRQGSPHRVLVEESAASPMLVVGRHRAGAVESAVVGSTALACASRADVPVTIVPDTWSFDRGERRCVIVGVDVAAGCAAAVRYAFELAAERGWRVLVVHATGPSSDRAREAGDDLDVALYRRTAPVFASAIGRMRQAYAALPVTTLTEHGHPSEVLERCAEDADLVVLGGQRRARLSEALFGSTTRSVISGLSVPVTVVHDSAARLQPERVTVGADVAAASPS